MPDSTLIAALLEPLSYPLDPAKRIFWGCCLSSLVLASIAVAYRAGTFDLRRQLAALINPRYWFNSSTATDLLLLFTNSVLRLSVLIPIVGSHLWFTLYVGRFWQSTLGDAPDILAPFWLIALSYGIVFFVLEDLSRFLLHRVMHRSNALWRIHRVHHRATVLTPLTLFRVHPAESLLYFFRQMSVFGFVSGTFIWIFGARLTAWDVLGVDALGFLFNAFGANLRHSHVWFSFGPLEKLFISPAQHQLHHSKSHGHPNYGAALSIWDRMAKTNMYAEKYSKLEFGLNEEVKNKRMGWSFFKVITFFTSKA
tara:strand:- start:5380 stop:6309 length:930 start_codon:yes stop_codon:yes gene_type:complete